MEADEGGALAGGIPISPKYVCGKSGNHPLTNYAWPQTQFFAFRLRRPA